MICVEIKVQAPFNSGSLAVGARCFSRSMYRSVLIKVT